MLLENKVAIITGASRGIGKAIAFAFAKEGAKLALCATNSELLEGVCAEIHSQFGTKPIHFAFDIRESSKVEEAVKKTLDTYSRIDILVNNAGTTRDQLLALMSEESWDFVLSTNLKSVFLMTKAVIKPMIKQRNGRIINLSSVVGIIGNAGQANYAASKGGVIALTKTTARELAKRNVTVNAIAPGFIQTDMTAKLGEKIEAAMINTIPLSRYGEAKEVADLAVFLASDQASYITGQVIGVDGGLSM